MLVTLAMVVIALLTGAVVWLDRRMGELKARHDLALTWARMAEERAARLEDDYRIAVARVDALRGRLADSKSKPINAVDYRIHGGTP